MPAAKNRVINTTLTPEMGSALESWMELQGIERKADAVRQIIAAHLAADSTDAEKIMIRQRLYNEVRLYAFTQLRRMVGEMMAEIDGYIAAASAGAR